MNNSNKNDSSIQKKTSVKQSCADARKAEQAYFIDQEKSLEEQKAALGHKNVSWEVFLETPIEDLDQASASRLIDVQNGYKDFLAQKRTFDSTVYLEPAKLPETVDAAEKLLINQSEIYQRAGTLVRITRISNTPHKNSAIKRPQDTLIIKEIDQAYLTMYLSKIGSFVIFDGRSEAFKKIDCPEKIARYLLAKQQWNVSILAGIINAPTLRSDGSIIDKPGYDPESGLLFLPNDDSFQEIPVTPTRREAEEAKKVLLIILQDFPFEDEPSRSVALAAILTALIRHSIPTAPLFGFTAPKMASGKSLLADIVAMIVIGRSNSVIAQAENETEEKKRILGILMEGDPIICFDNIEKPFKSAALCSILTQYEYKDRILGTNTTRTVPTKATFLATGNNLVFMGDISTRTLLCRLDPQAENPEERSFSIDLRDYIPQHRGLLVKAGLTILRAFIIAGKPSQNIKPYGRFEEWSSLIRSAIIWIGLADPCESRKEIEKSDPVRVALRALFAAWHAIFQDRPIKLKEITDAIFNMSDTDENLETLKEACEELASDNKGVLNKRALSKKLTYFKNRIEDGYRLEQYGIHQGTTLWRVIKVETKK